MIAVAGVGQAKPLLTNSQETYVSTCLDQSDTPERIIEICQHGLGNVGASDRQRIEMLDKLAWAYYDLDDIGQADDAFAEILTLNPDAELGLQGLAWVYYNRDDCAAATAMFRQAVSRKPNASNMAGLAASARRAGEMDFADFEEMMQTALALNPEYTWAMRELVWKLVDHNRQNEALSLFRTTSELDPYDPYAEYGVAFLLSEQNDWEAAFDHVSRALELKPDFVTALSRRSLILLMLDRPKQALKDAEAVIEAEPGDSDGYVRKARALSDLGQRSQAHEVLELAESRVGPGSYLLYWWANLLADDLEYEAALFHIRRSVALEGVDRFDNRLHADIALGPGHTDEARDAIDQALGLYPDGEFEQYTNALVLLAEGRFDAAESMFDSATAAGLHQDYLSDFLAALVAEGRFMQAIKMRARHKNGQPDATSDAQRSN
ncbi:lipopolysaccharide assembly protein LapB [Ruegeria sp. Alg231-54]|uniref:tetratricopeptide repeat protein n=1 Tax=Ruegeria sp. Alg231-54 TaxID=1922221 RepID=UPI000D559104|nr:tetratricopeptide repeat protein [Ruegeria sp. Alg231-54]